ncbi:putative phage abortive infection protein [Marinobacter gelidimuriae]|uniref:putative phage abortive infection protein n=1 Tax=Marinobacter gelidimuriae TaxID=2739064 RepID=UPI00036A1709|nr:putative phage abortive infection protein [Marinobacter gelidimuriae]
MLKKVVLVATALAISIVAVACYFYFDQFSGGFSSKSSDWGDFGAYIGGAVGAIFASLSFLALLYTVFLQREELTTAINALEDGAESQRKQVENHEAQKFESTFYSLLDLHNRAVKDLDFKSVDFSGYLHNLETDDSVSVDSYLAARQEHILENVELSQYFRVLYQLLKFIAKNNIRNKEKQFSELSLECRDTISKYENDEKMYASLVRSFVPVRLLPVLALNCIPTYTGLNNLKRYWALLERYSFLEHMRLDHLPINMSSFLIFHRYSYAMGEKGQNVIEDLVRRLKSKYPDKFQSDLMEGGYLHTYADHV